MFKSKNKISNLHSQPIVKVKILKSRTEQSEFNFKDSFRIGRSSSCQIRFHDTVVSRKHTEVFIKDGGWWICDLHSSNGTYINGSRIDQYPLQEDSKIQLGRNGPVLILSVVATIDYYGLSDRGLRRPDNQDSFGKFPPGNADLSIPEGHLFIVADGMGGHAGGKQASSMAVNIVNKVYFSDLSANVPDRLKMAVETANQEIHEEALRNEQTAKMGTTCTALVLSGKQATIAHVGDSRLYRISKNKIEQLTQDHTKIAEMLKHGVLSKKEAKNHPERSVLNRALGVQSNVDVDIIAGIPVQNEDYFLLCTDGLKNVSDEEIENTVLENSSQNACEILVQLANNRGGDDNVTVQVIRMNRSSGQYSSYKKNQVLSSSHRWFSWILLFLFIFIISLGLFFFRDQITLLLSHDRKSDQIDEKSAILSLQNTEYKQKNKKLDSLYTEANDLLAGNKFDEAINIFQTVLTESPMHIGAIDGINQIAEFYKKRAKRLKQEKKYQQSLTFFNKALVLRPKDGTLQKEMKQLQQQMKK